MVIINKTSNNIQDTGPSVYLHGRGNITAGVFTAESVGNTFVQVHEDQILVQQLEHVMTSVRHRARKLLRFTMVYINELSLLQNASASGVNTVNG